MNNRNMIKNEDNLEIIVNNTSQFEFDFSLCHGSYCLC